MDYKNSDFTSTADFLRRNRQNYDARELSGDDYEEFHRRMLTLREDWSVDTIKYFSDIVATYNIPVDDCMTLLDISKDFLVSSNNKAIIVRFISIIVRNKSIALNSIGSVIPMIVELMQSKVASIPYTLQILECAMTGGIVMRYYGVSVHAMRVLVENAMNKTSADSLRKLLARRFAEFTLTSILCGQYEPSEAKQAVFLLINFSYDSLDSITISIILTLIDNSDIDWEELSEMNVIDEIRAVLRNGNVNAVTVKCLEAMHSLYSSGMREYEIEDIYACEEILLKNDGTGKIVTAAAELIIDIIALLDNTNELVDRELQDSVGICGANGSFGIITPAVRIITCMFNKADIEHRMMMVTDAVFASFSRALETEDDQVTSAVLETLMGMITLRPGTVLSHELVDALEQMKTDQEIVGEILGGSAPEK